jgi:ATP-binding cassette subfamily C protein/ATP-binding cassette subfamily C exporter for protease/lipase
MLVGVLKPNSGHVRLDGADTFEWMRSDFGQHVGYLPQDIELLPGTVRQNIARFRADASDADVIAAAKLADCHEMILQLEGGYDCMLTDGGFQLSGGQRQRIGLARALFGAPRLVVLDEPNSSLDARGDAALALTIQRLKAMKVTTVIVSHRANLLQLADRIAMLMDGRLVKFGEAREVIDNMAGRKLPPNGQRSTAATANTGAASQRPVMFNKEGMGQ